MDSGYLLVAVEYRDIIFNHAIEADSEFSPHLFQDVWRVLGGAERPLGELVLDSMHLVHVGDARSCDLDAVLLFI